MVECHGLAQTAEKIVQTIVMLCLDLGSFSLSSYFIVSSDDLACQRKS